MLNSSFAKLFGGLILIGLFFPGLVALAQTDGSAMPRETQSAINPPAVATATDAGTSPQEAGVAPTSPSATSTSSSAELPQATGTIISPAPAQTATSAPSSAPRPPRTQIAPQNIATSTPSPVTTAGSGLPSEDAGTDSANPITIAMATIIAVIFGALGVSRIKKYSRDKKVERNGDNRCDNIKELLAQKKRELEEMARNWPEEKIKEIAKNKILEELGKEEGVKRALGIAVNAKDKYDKLKGAVEMLQKRYDLCMLSFPGKGTTPYHGTIIENSLNDKAILEKLDIKKSYESGSWLLHEVSVNEKQIGKIGEFLNDGAWYAHFWRSGKDDVIIVFKDKSFRLKGSDKSTWKEAFGYGKSKGIPEEKLDFSAH